MMPHTNDAKVSVKQKVKRNVRDKANMSFVRTSDETRAVEFSVDFCLNQIDDM